MNNEYSIDKNSKVLIFNCKLKQLRPSSVNDEDKNKFTSVVIPNSVNAIEDRVFLACSSLMAVHISNSITTIGDWAFYNCGALTTVHLPNSVNSVGFRAFGDNKHLNKVFLLFALKKNRADLPRPCFSVAHLAHPPSPCSDSQFTKKVRFTKYEKSTILLFYELKTHNRPVIQNFNFRRETSQPLQI